jgi:site-specific recombinase XerC
MKKNISNEFVLYRNITIVELFLATGIRKAELVGLDLTDVFPEKNMIMVMRKGNQETPSEIAVPKDMMDALMGYISMRNKIGFATNALFVSHRTGKRVGEETIRKFFEVYSGGKITPHRLRDTYGCSIYADTGDIKLVQEQLGHASVETTAKNYVMVDEERSIAAINSLSCWRFD